MVLLENSEEYFKHSFFLGLMLRQFFLFHEKKTVAQDNFFLFMLDCFFWKSFCQHCM